MKKRLAALLLAVGIPAIPARAMPDSSGHVLAQCLAASTTERDRGVLIRWMFMAMARHAAVEDVARVTKQDRESVNREMARLFDRLLSEDCREQAVAAMRENPSTTLGSAFGVLGEIAGQEIFVDPAVNEELMLLVDYLDVDALTEELSDGQPR